MPSLDDNHYRRAFMRVPAEIDTTKGKLFRIMLSGYLLYGEVNTLFNWAASGVAREMSELNLEVNAFTSANPGAPGYPVPEWLSLYMLQVLRVNNWTDDYLNMLATRFGNGKKFGSEGGKAE